MLRQYNPKDVTVIFGAVIMSGFAEDSMVTVERNVDTYALKVGVDGEGTRTRSANKSGKVTVRLMQSSFVNDLLSAIALTDELSGNGVFPLMIKDGSGTTLCMAETAWIVKPPSSELGGDPKDREWIFETDLLVMHVGGNGA